MSVQVFNQSQISEKLQSNEQLLRDTICKGATPQEFDLFKHICIHTGLDPFLKQVYTVKRWNTALKREEMTVQTSIDGYRLIADRTGKYVPGRESTFTYDDKGCLVSATAYIKKMTNDGTWHEISACAYFDEYVQKNKEGKVTSMWEKMPRIMLSKCAETMALRKGFPYEMSALRTDEEMSQADKVDTNTGEITKNPEFVTANQIETLERAIKDYPKYRDIIFKKWTDFSKIPYTQFHMLLEAFENWKSKQPPTHSMITSPQIEIVPGTIDDSKCPF